LIFSGNPFNAVSPKLTAPNTSTDIIPNFFAMRVSLILNAAWLTLAFAQTYPECTADLVKTDDCAAVIDANACYNQNRFQNAQTLACIDGKDDTDRKRKVGADT
jgi:hypothetical protein